MTNASKADVKSQVSKKSYKSVKLTSEILKSKALSDVKNAAEENGELHKEASSVAESGVKNDGGERELTKSVIERHFEKSQNDNKSTAVS